MSSYILMFKGIINLQIWDSLWGIYRWWMRSITYRKHLFPKKGKRNMNYFFASKPGIRNLYVCVLIYKYIHLYMNKYLGEYIFMKPKEPNSTVKCRSYCWIRHARHSCITASLMRDRHSFASKYFWIFSIFFSLIRAAWRNTS